MRRILLLVPIVLALVAPLAVPMSAQLPIVHMTGSQFITVGPQLYCGGMPYPC
jgi:hypothetical protein